MWNTHITVKFNSLKMRFLSENQKTNDTALTCNPAQTARVLHDQTDWLITCDIEEQASQPTDTVRCTSSHDNNLAQAW